VAPKGKGEEKKEKKRGVWYNIKEDASSFMKRGGGLQRFSAKRIQRIPADRMATLKGEEGLPTENYLSLSHEGETPFLREGD